MAPGELTMCHKTKISS